MKTECPKCGSHNAWYAKTLTDLVVRCMCGYHQVVWTSLETVEISHCESRENVKLPRPGTKLSRTLLSLACLEEASSVEVTERLLDLGELCSVSDASTYLSILRAKGLVVTVQERKGLVGGSIWCLTDAACDLLNV